MMYLDTNVIIYAIEQHPRYGKACKRILADIESGKLEAAASHLVLVEVVSVLQRINKTLGARRLDLRANIDALLSLPIVWYELSPFLIQRAAEYRYNINGADYAHLATMELNNLSDILSADTDFDRVEFVKRVDPLAYRSP